MNDAITKLYVLIADALVASVKARRITATEARVPLQQAYLDAMDREKAADAEAEAARERQHEDEERAAQLEAEREQAEQERQAREAAEMAQAEQQRQAYATAVQFYIDQARARRAAFNSANPSAALGQNLGAALGGAAWRISRKRRNR